MRDLKSIEIECTAPPGVRDAIASLGRTEDVHFSPSNRRLAVAAYGRNRIAVFDIDIASSAAGRQVALTGAMELSSPALNRPHGLDFIDDTTLIVANREGDVAIFKLPTGKIDAQLYEARPIQTLPVGGTSLLKSPGSVAVAGVERDLCEILVCNNFEHNITRHRLDLGAGCVVRSNEVLLRKWLAIPDGVRVSHDRRWIAVSNHQTHSVLLYENLPSLNQDTDPDGMLRRVFYPHGLCFSSDGRYVFVADAGAPYVHVYASEGDGWRGVRHPVASIRIMDESLFLRGRHSPQGGGPKGIDIDAGSNILVVTSVCQPLTFFDVPAVLELAAAGNSVQAWDPHSARATGSIDGQIDDAPYEESQREQRALEVRYELHVLEQAEFGNIEAKASVAYMQNSRSWRITAPLRRLDSAFKRFRARREIK